MILIVENGPRYFEFGIGRNHQFLPDNFLITPEILVNAEVVILINPKFHQLIDIRRTRFRTKDVFVALHEKFTNEIRLFAERYGFQILNYSSEGELDFIRSVLTVFHARISFGADDNDFRNMIAGGGRVEYCHMMLPILDREITKIQPMRTITSILTTLFYDKSYSFDAIERISMQLKLHFSTTNIVSVLTESDEQPVSLGLFLVSR